MLELDIVFSPLFAMSVTQKEIPEHPECLFLIGEQKTISAWDSRSTELHDQIRLSKELARCRREAGKNPNH